VGLGGLLGIPRLSVGRVCAGSRASTRLSESVVGVVILAITGVLIDVDPRRHHLPSSRCALFAGHDLDLSDASKSWIIWATRD
jgi:hypothetical protein